MRPVEWIKTHKVAIILIVVVYFGYQFVSAIFGINILRLSAPATQKIVTNPSFSGLETGSSFGAASGGLSLAPSFSLDQRSATSTNADQRLVVQNSNLSLLVVDVRESGDKILTYAKQTGGFMVSTSYSRPTESPFATITVRVPSARFDEALAYFRSLSIKVTNENLVGVDVTEQFVDIDERIRTYERTKQKFESIMDSAITTQELLNVQRELINIQTQIDSLKGQKQSIEQNVALTKFTVYLSTDELALPYTPDKTFRPDVVFKLAVRSLLNSLRVIGEASIWVVVYAVIWVPALLIYFGIRKWRERRKVLKQT